MEDKFTSKLFRGKHYFEVLDINNGIFKGDSLSPLVFCLALTPCSYELNDTGCGYKIGEEKINHLLSMDDLKLYGKNDKELDGLLCTVKKFSDDTGMEFVLNVQKPHLLRED